MSKIKVVVQMGVMLVATGAASAQTSELFINQFDNAGMVVVQGGAVVRSWNTVGPAENALAVADDIRTAGSHQFTDQGYQYDLNGVLLGGAYSVSLGGWIYDGTTDGVVHNYAVTEANAGLYQFDREWNNATLLFQIGSNGFGGVTYDMTDRTLWISQSYTLSIFHYDLNGTLLGSFPVQGDNTYGLALDAADGTLWAGRYQSNVITQYKKDGTYLGSVTVPGIDSAFGMEFNRCASDLDGNGVLDLFDFLTFTNLFNAADPTADCTGDGVFDLFDFLCFVNSFNAGC